MRTTRSHARDVTFAALACTAALGVREAHAQSDVDVEKLYREGVALMKQGKDVEAEAKLQQSWDLKRTVDTATNLGEVELDVGQDVEAATHLDYAERHMPNSLSPVMKKRIGELAAKARAKVGALDIKTTPADALIAVDGKELGRSLEGPAFVLPGTHEVTASLAGHDTEKTSVQATAGKLLPVVLTLKPTAGAPVLPPVAPPPPTGSVLPPPAVDEDQAAPVAAWATVGAGATIAVAGGVLLVVGLASQSGAKDDAEAIVSDSGRCEPASAGFESRCDEMLSSGDSANLLTGIGGAALGVGAATAVVGLVWALTSRSSGAGESTGLLLLPVTSPSSAGVLASGRF